MKNSLGLKAVLLLSTSLLWYGCSSAPKGNINSESNPNDVVAAMESNITTGDQNGLAVLDSENFKKSKEYLSKAKDGLKDNDDQKDILEDLSISQGYFEKAQKTAESRKAKLQTVLESRQLAIDAGVSQYPRLSDKWKNAEDETRDLADKKSDNIDRTDLKKLQAKYLELQLDSIKAKHIGDAESTITSAKEKGGAKKAPITLKEAEIRYDSAVSKISTNRDSPELFMEEVNKSNYTATRLHHVMGYVKDEKFSEPAAIELVNQKEKIGALGTAVAVRNDRLSKQGDKLANSQEQLAASQNQVAFQEALDKASKQFNSSEADVYQQGDQLIIRLKSLNFASGKSALPNNGASLLNRIETVADGLSAKTVMVQGHTDSIGSKTSNQKLSEDRANTVAKYLEQNGFTDAKIESEGFGDTKPIKNNKSRADRAQNRRIDIVITPATL